MLFNKILARRILFLNLGSKLYYILEKSFLSYKLFSYSIYFCNLISCLSIEFFVIFTFITFVLLTMCVPMDWNFSISFKIFLTEELSMSTILKAVIFTKLYLKSSKLYISTSWKIKIEHWVKYELHKYNLLIRVFQNVFNKLLLF